MSDLFNHSNFKHNQSEAQLKERQTNQRYNDKDLVEEDAVFLESEISQNLGNFNGFGSTKGSYQLFLNENSVCNKDSSMINQNYKGFDIFISPYENNTPKIDQDESNVRLDTGRSVNPISDKEKTKRTNLKHIDSVEILNDVYEKLHRK